MGSESRWMEMMSYHLFVIDQYDANDLNDRKLLHFNWSAFIAFKLVNTGMSIIYDEEVSIKIKFLQARHFYHLK